MKSMDAQPVPTNDYYYDNNDDHHNDDATTEMAVVHSPSSSSLKSNGFTDSRSSDEFSYASEVHFYPLEGSYQQKLYDWAYPSNVPRELQILRLENLAIPTCYLLVGIMQGLSGPLINVYPLDLGATEAQQASVGSLRSLPATFKILFGFWSDNYKLFGYRRKSYMGLGWIVSSLSMIILLFVGGNNPSIPLLSFSFLMMGTGFWFADVMGDSIVAEKAKLETIERRGNLQSTCYACRFFGLMVSAPFSTVIYSSIGANYVISLLAIFPLFILPIVYVYKERYNVKVKSPGDQCKEIWSTVCSRAVWQPMGFVYLYNTLQVGNAAWREFLKTVLEFSSNQLNSLLIIAYVLLYLGILAYKYYFIRWSWRAVYIWTTLLNGVLSALQILLIEGITFGLSPYVFALGDDAMADFIGGIQFLPTTIMMVHLCPSGSEGASYAMFTTVNNSALTLSGAISTMLLPIWDVSKEAMEDGDLSGMTNLTILTTALQLSGICFVFLLPRTKEELVALVPQLKVELEE
eukprot:CAMPEP_0116055494 /NCGR_PEP_ID=MMETSP0322-20121206/3442_1 /TAXON_ID=163516 /ORGANISM="Leptocylindrus danicus var. apora, Strain B651" /LENGTH=518 /DNA_ID=CAMNT_0003539111 /DNA_START=64 /DNA_END=1621 /DNA_ORIENTATION=-